MKKLTYVGPGPGRIIAATGQVCLAGESVDVDDDLARSLLAQDVWAEAAKPKKSEETD